MIKPTTNRQLRDEIARLERELATANSAYEAVAQINLQMQRELEAMTIDRDHVQANLDGALDLIESLERLLSAPHGRTAEALEVVFSHMDENGDPVGAQPETSWEQGYCDGLRYAYRVLKQHGVPLPASHMNHSALKEG